MDVLAVNVPAAAPTPRTILSLFPQVDWSAHVHLALVVSQTSVPYAAVASSVLFAFAPLADIRRIRDARNTLSLPFLPFFFYLLQSVMFLLYACATANTLLMLTTTLGTVMGASYVRVYYAFTDHKASARRWLSAGGLVAAILVGVVATCNPAVAALYIGVPGNAVMIMTAVSPLAKVRHIVATRDASSLPVGMSVMNAVAGGIWTLYGMLLDDMLVIFPNAVSTVVGLVQVALILRYAPAGKDKRDHVV
ncbi:Aste57867_24064 [Aphanomyces stellatus]|uniref:Sugar transporter SWEET1 n=1 Tax=Aphanomyces stellatus TaxID=120398 RepID=A0A485LTT0_9STRA|nr:hypothetical protein As57867_023991 [Aphanomyces stellatus]VFU00707.1 Aste57867_24064 [Aphanomyces stellatus]